MAAEAAAQAAARPASTAARSSRGVVVATFGDSVLDCGHYNPHGAHPGQLLVRNDDALFPEFQGWDLASRGPVRLEHRAVDGATFADLPAQLSGLRTGGPGIALLSVGGNDLLRGLAGAEGQAGIDAFGRALEAFVRRVPMRPLFIANVYDPSFGDDSRNFLPVDARVARANHRRINDTIRAVAARHGRLVDLHAHFLRGDASWFTRTIEPSLRGASEVRRAFIEAIGVPR